MERGLVRLGGTDDALGRPFLFVTTPQFLENFGLQDLNDLPLADRLRKTREAGDGAHDTE
jgi:segregation and condensation protein B